VSFINSRIRKLERRTSEGRCSECAGARGIVLAYDEAAQREALEERCPRCGWAPSIIRVVYDGDEEGEGVSPIEQMHRDKA
jgi:hypothetical protein